MFFFFSNIVQGSHLLLSNNSLNAFFGQQGQLNDEGHPFGNGIADQKQQQPQQPYTDIVGGEGRDGEGVSEDQADSAGSAASEDGALVF